MAWRLFSGWANWGKPFPRRGKNKFESIAIEDICIVAQLGKSYVHRHLDSREDSNHVKSERVTRTLGEQELYPILLPIASPDSILAKGVNE